MSGLDSSRRQSATRRFSPPESVSIFASHGGRRSASAAISSVRSSVCAVARGEDRLEPLLLGGELVEIGAFLGIGRVDLLELLLRLEDLADAFLDALAHGFLRIELGLLREKADLDVGLRARLAVKFVVDAGHDAQDGRFARRR